MNPRAFAVLVAVAVSLLLGSCKGRIHEPPGHAPPPDAGGSVDAGTAPDAGSVPPAFTPDPPAVYLAKVKNILIGLPPSAAEVAAVEADSTQLGTLVDGWMRQPEYAAKMLRFFEQAFQQTQVSGGTNGPGDFQDQVGALNTLAPNGANAPLLLQNLQESFARTMVAFADAGVPFNQAMTTRQLMMTTGLKVFYGFLDDYQVGDKGPVPFDGADVVKQQTPGLMTFSVTGQSVPLSQTVDPSSLNFMHWSFPDFVDAGCPSDPTVVNASSLGLYNMLHGGLLFATHACTGERTYHGPLQPPDFQDWRMTTLRQPVGPERTTPFWDVPALRTTDTLVLSGPRVGFFTTPAFFANWQTNASNQMRVTINQTFIVATGAQVDGSDSTVPATTPGLDSAHAAPGTGCYGCHQTLDPSRSIFAATYSWNYGPQGDPSFSGQPGLFAFQQVIQPVSTLYDFGAVLSQHPLLAPGWAQKLCYYVNSEACVESDPEFQKLVDAFTHSNYSWNQLVKAVVTSPITTHASSTLTTTTNGEVVAVARRDHLCAALNARLGFQDLCGLDVSVPRVLPGAALQVVASMPSDGYARGSAVPVLPTSPTLFLRGGMENFCEALALLVVDNPHPPAGVTPWSSSNSAVAISDFVAVVMGIVPTDPRGAQMQTSLTQHFSAASKLSGVTASTALRSTFTAACLSPSALSVGL